MSEGGAVAVVGQRLDDDRDAAGAITLIADVVVVLAIGADRLLDGALDIVLAACFPGAPRSRRRAGAHSSPGRAVPSLAATVISRASLPNSLDFIASCRPLRCMMFLNWECPAMREALRKGLENRNAVVNGNCLRRGFIGPRTTKLKANWAISGTPVWEVPHLS